MDRVDGENKTSVLLVDGNVDVREATAEVLEALGYRVTTAASSSEALRLVECWGPFAVLITDTPDGSGGFEFLDHLLSQMPGIAVLLCSSVDVASGLVDPAYVPRLRQRLAETGVVFLRKPFSSGDLTAKIDEALSLAKQRPAARPRRLLPASNPFPSRVLLWRLAASIFLVLGSGLLASAVMTQPPDLPSLVQDQVVRGSEIELLSPLGTLQRMPTIFRWQPHRDAASYRIQVSGVDGEVLWQRRVSASEVPIGGDLEASLHSAVLYHWTVDALNPDGEILARSRPRRFLVQP